MSEFRFYGSWSDATKLMDYLVNLEQYTFVLDRWYLEPTPQVFTRLTAELEPVLHRQKRVFVWSKGYSSMRVHFSGPGPQGYSIIDPARSAPMLDLLLPNSFAQGDSLFLGMGGLSHQTRYVDPATETLYPPPTQLVRDYQEIRKVIRKEMVRRYVAVEVPTAQGWEWRAELLWITKSGVKLLETDQANVRAWGELLTAGRLKATAEEALLTVDRY